MTTRKRSEVVIPPSSDARCNPIAWRIIAQRDWRENLMPPQDKRHSETRRNEVFLMNVTPREFTHLHTIFPIGDFKRARLGDVALTAAGMIVPDYKPMFGALKTGARKRRKENKQAKRKRRSKK
jgi:hypothetical protein